MLNHHDGITLIAQLMQYFQQLLNIGKVQTVKEKEKLAAYREKMKALMKRGEELEKL